METMRYGHFDDQRREYVITRSDTPLPWINYLGSEAYFGLISNTAGGTPSIAMPACGASPATATTTSPWIAADATSTCGTGIEAQTRYFVPLGESPEIWQLTLTNRRQQPARLSVFSSIEFCLWDAQDDATNFQRNFNVGEVEVPPLSPPHGVTDDGLCWTPVAMALELDYDVIMN